MPDEHDEQAKPLPDKLRVKRGYTLSEAALEARRKNSLLSTGPRTAEGKSASSKNSWKHGQYSQSFIMGVLGKTCKTTCPEFGTCQFINDNATSPGDRCLDRQHMVEAFGNIIDAIENDDHKNFRHMAAFEMAGGIEVLRSLKEAIITDGVLLKSEKRDKNGNIFYEYVIHPAINAYNSMMEKQGITFKDFNLTPKEIAKVGDPDDDDESLSQTLAKALKNVSEIQKNR